MSKAPAGAVSASALQTALAAPPSPAAGGFGDAGSAQALERLTRAMQELKAISIEPMLQKAVEAIHAEDPKTAAEWAIKALQQDERSGFAWCLLAIARERSGDFASSLAAYEAALQLLPNHAEIAHDIGRLALRMGMPEQAEKFFRHFLDSHPDHPEGLNNLGCALREQGRRDEAIELLRAAILKTPEVAMLWNSLGAVVGEQGDAANAAVFFGEALRLDPKFPKARYNWGNMKLALGDAAGALEACEAALAATQAEHDRAMMRLARATILMALGRIGEGWDEYEARLDPQFADVTQFAVGAPAWEPGAPLAGKSLLVIGEQGLGDEILFANLLPDVIERLGPKGRLTLAVEKRLIPLFERSFPGAAVGAHVTAKTRGRTVRAVPFLAEGPEPDLWAPMGSLLREFRRELSAFPAEGGYMRADPARVAHWKAALEAAGPGPKVGLLWKSAVAAGARHRYFSPFEQWAPVLRQPGACFVNLQYGDCGEELAWVKRELGVEIWNPPGIDLKQDLDEVAALSSAMDLVLGFSNATFNIAAACGTPAWLITTPAAWPRLGTEDRYPWYPQTRVFAPGTYGEWSEVMAEVAEALASFAGGAER